MVSSGLEHAVAEPGLDVPPVLEAIEALRPGPQPEPPPGRRARLGLTRRRLAVMAGAVAAATIAGAWAVAARGPAGLPALPPSSTTASFPGLDLTLRAEPSASGAARTARFSLTAQVGDDRVLRGVRFELGEGTAVETSVPTWACGDPGAPDPSVVDGPSFAYGMAGTYSVTATVRTAPCVAGDPGAPEESFKIRLDLVVP